MKVAVFLGPTMTVDQARAILPDALYLRPARQADVLSVVRNHRPDFIALIDGTFHQTLSVWHKEILYALSEGVRVYGSSSMGALRAAECAPFGMIGIGAIYDAYADGTYTDDDEVALAHGDAEHGYRGLSTPMVNVRATLEAARRDGVVDEAGEALVVAAAKARFFPERQWPTIIADAERLGLGAEAAEGLKEFLADHPVDQKRADAELLLRTLRDLPSDPARWPKLEPVAVTRSHVFDALCERDRRVIRAGGAEVSLEEISRYVMLHHPGSAAIMARAVNRMLVSALADLVHVEVGEAEIESELARFRTRLRLETDVELEAYLVRNDLDEGELRELMAGEATARRLRAWLTVRRYKLGLGRPLLDELRLGDEYGAWADAAAEHELILAESFGAMTRLTVEKEEVADLLRGHARATGWRPDTDLYTWADEADFGQSYDVLIEMKRSAMAREVLDAASGGSSPTNGDGRRGSS